MDKALKEATIAQLSQALSQALATIPWADVLEMKNDPTSPTLQELEVAQESVNTFLISLDRTSVD